MLLKKFKDGLHGVEAEKRIKKLELRKHNLLISFKKNSISYLIAKTLLILILFIPSMIIRYTFLLIETFTEKVANLTDDLMDLDNDIIALILMPFTLICIILVTISFPVYYFFRALYNVILLIVASLDYGEYKLINHEIKHLEHQCLGCGVTVPRKPRNHRFCYRCWKLWSQESTRHLVRERYNTLLK